MGDGSWLEGIVVSYLTFFVDMVYYIQEDWDILLSSIREGIIPDIDHIDHVLDSLQVGVYEAFNHWQMLTGIGWCVLIHSEWRILRV